MTAAPPVSTADLDAHPAIRAWTALNGSAAAPVIIETLKEKKGRPLAVYRLRLRDVAVPIIAKRSGADETAHERRIYEDVLPRLPVTTVQYYGSVVTHTDSVGWLFIEDAGTIPYSPLLPDHRALAAEWLGKMHAHSVAVVNTAALPERGFEWYRQRLHAACRLLEHALNSEPLRAASYGMQTTFRRILRWCVVTDARWPRLSEACQAIPCTLVHADFVGENVRVRSGTARRELLPFDWGTSGYGVPARDLVGIDIASYYPFVRDHWSGVTESDLERAARAGRVFRRVAAIHRSCLSLPYRPAEKILSDIRYLAVRA